MKKNLVAEEHCFAIMDQKTGTGFSHWWNSCFIHDEWKPWKLLNSQKSISVVGEWLYGH